MDYSRNPVSGTQSGPVTIPPHVYMEIGQEFQLELEIQQVHGTSRIQCKAMVKGFNGTGSWVKIVGYGEVSATFSESKYHGNGRPNGRPTDS